MPSPHENDGRQSQQDFTLNTRTAIREAMVGFYKDELDRYAYGEIQRPVTERTLGSMFGYSPRGAYHSLRKEGLLERKREIEATQVMPQSTDTAWLLGVLAAGGHIDANSINVSTRDKRFLKTFKRTFEKVFGINGAERDIKRSTHPTPEVTFQSKRVADLFGDLRKDAWHTTIEEKHDWIFGDDTYVWKFLEGVIDMRGGLIGQRKNMAIYLTSEEAINFVSNLLVRQGVKRPTLNRDAGKSSGLAGIYINNKKDLRHIAEHIHLKEQDKDARLDVFRKMPDEVVNRRTYVRSNEEVIAEWKRLSMLLGRSPSTRDIARLKRQGVTSFSVNVYRRRFGQDGLFASATETLNSLTLDNEAAPAQVETHQVFPEIK
jgi:hypothetical protein